MRLGKLLTVVAMLFIYLPVVISFIGSFSPAWHIYGLFSGFTLKWYAVVLEDFGHTIGLSILIALICVLINLFLGTLAGYALARYRFRSTELLEGFLMLPSAVPGIAIALALVQTYPLIRGYWYFILIGHVVFTLPFMVNSMLSGMRSFGLVHLEEAAFSLGSSWWFCFTRIVLPNVWRSLINGVLMVFILSMGEFNMTYFLHTPLNMTLPVGLFDSYASLRLEIASAYTVIFFLIAVPILVVMQYFGEKKHFFQGNV